MTTAEHVAAVEEAIRRSGGPDNIRFAAVATEAIAQAPSEEAADGPVVIWFEGRDDALVNIFLKRTESATRRLSPPRDPGKSS